MEHIKVTEEKGEGSKFVDEGSWKDLEIWILHKTLNPLNKKGWTTFDTEWSLFGSIKGPLWKECFGYNNGVSVDKGKHDTTQESCIPRRCGYRNRFTLRSGHRSGRNFHSFQRSFSESLSRSWCYFIPQRWVTQKEFGSKEEGIHCHAISCWHHRRVPRKSLWP